MTGGIGKLYETARNDYGFAPRAAYAGKCDLCYDIRRFLVIERDVSSRDLRPAELYRQMSAKP